MNSISVLCLIGLLLIAVYAVLDGLFLSAGIAAAFIVVSLVAHWRESR